MSENPTDIDKYYFYITGDNKVVLGCETEPNVFYNKVIGDISQLKGKNIKLNMEICSPDEDTHPHPRFIDFIFSVLKSI